MESGIKLGGCIAVIVLFGLITLAMNPFVTVGTGERALIVNKGSVTGQMYSEGWYTLNPFVEDAKYFDIKTQVVTTEAEAASNDIQDVKAKVTIQYALKPEKLVDIARNIGGETELIDRVITPAIQESIKASTSKFKAEDIVRDRTGVKDSIVVSLRARLDQYGIWIQDAAIENVTFSDQFTTAIEAKQVAEQNAQKAEFEKQAAVKQAEAEQEKQRLLQVNLTPDTLERLWIEKWNGVLPTYVGADMPLYMPVQNKQ